MTAKSSVGSGRTAPTATPDEMPSGSLPLTALLARAWLVFTIQADNLFEVRMPHHTTLSKEGRGPWLVSHTMWWNCMRFVDESGISIADLEARARTRTNLNGMLRWGYLSADAAHRPLNPRTTLRATRAGMLARRHWEALGEEVEALWRRRLGDERIARLTALLAQISTQLNAGLPDCLPILHYGLQCPAPVKQATGLPAQTLQPLLARPLLALTLEYEQDSSTALAVDANLLRLMGDQETPVRELLAGSGVSKEAMQMMLALLQRRRLLTVRSERNNRWVELSTAGRTARAEFVPRLAVLENQWSERHGRDAMMELRQTLETILTGTAGSGFTRDCLAPPATGWRARTAAERPLPWQPMVLHRGGYPDGA